jgi:phage terminase large subunit
LYITKNSTNIVKEIQQYKWKENREGQVFDEPVKLHDDAMDAMRYAAFMTLRKKKNLMVCFAEM